MLVHARKVRNIGEAARAPPWQRVP